jgi:Regulator of ribonuclease activity B
LILVLGDSDTYASPLVSHITVAASAVMITRDMLVEMFHDISEKSGWDMSQNMVWGYFFTHSSPNALQSASLLLAEDGYHYVDIYQQRKESDSEPEVWWLHVEKVETHSVDSLHERNEALSRFAEENGLDSYDGMDVGPVERVQ